MHYAAHAETLTTIFEVLGIDWHIRSTPASAAFFEFIDVIEQKENGKNFTTPILKVLYRDGNTKSYDYLKLKGNSEYIKLDEFIDYLDRRISLIPFNDT